MVIKNRQCLSVRQSILFIFSVDLKWIPKFPHNFQLMFRSPQKKLLETVLLTENVTANNSKHFERFFIKC